MGGFKQKMVDVIKLCVLNYFRSGLMMDIIIYQHKRTNIETIPKWAKISPILGTLRSPFFGTIKTL